MAFGGTAPGLLGSITLGQLAGPAEVLVTFWETQASAVSFAGPRPQPAGPRGRVYEVADAREGMAAAHAPLYALVPYFDGPQLPEMSAAADRAWRQRLWPAIRDVDGLVAAYVLRQDDLGAVVLQLGSSLEALEAAGQAIRATDLLPGEDPALLPGPDRIELHHVTGFSSPVPRPEAAHPRAAIAVPAAAPGASR
jgi:hypothetical protein